jgi:IS5 family transposase
MRPLVTSNAVPLPLYVNLPQARQYQRMSQLLDVHPEMEELVRQDLVRGLKEPDQGREGMSARQVLRALVIQRLTHLSYLDLSFYLADSVTCCLFCGFARPSDVPKKSALQDNLARVTEATLEQLNRLLLQEAKDQGVEKGTKTRTDCTVTETTIHAPTDSSLLWDGVRRLTVLLNHAATAGYAVEYHDNSREAKRKALAILSAPNEQERRPLYERLLEVAWDTTLEAQQGAGTLEQVIDDRRAQHLAVKLRQNVELTARVIDQTQRRVLEDKKVSAPQKVLSLFEWHTDLIVKDRRDSYFGHKVCLSFGKSSMILDCQVLVGNPADVTLAVPMMERHKQIYGQAPDKATFDGGFASQSNLDAIKGMGTKEVAFSKRRGIPVEQMCKSRAGYVRLRRFRAGAEGCISFMKRVVGMRRCSWKGPQGFRAYVWASVVAANLLILARHLL